MSNESNEDITKRIIAKRLSRLKQDGTLREVIQSAYYQVDTINILHDIDVSDIIPRHPITGNPSIGIIPLSEDFVITDEDIDKVQSRMVDKAKTKPETSAPEHRPISRFRHQEDEIIRVIVELGYNPVELPKLQPGKPWVKSEVRTRLQFTKGVFDKAWERLSSQNRINMKPTLP